MPAQKPIRRSQLISPFGVGAMVDFPRDESLMPAGLDAWPDAKRQCPAESEWLIREERLEARLGVSHLRQPPDFREPDRGASHAMQRVPFVRFPRWNYCHHCGGMEKVSAFSATRERCKGRKFDQQSCHAKPQYRRPFLIPVRFVAVCSRGHIQDFPFLEWVHRERPAAEGCSLRLRAGRSSAGLTGITVECSCGQRRTMGDVFRFDEQTGGPLSDIGCQCTGLRPWLGDMDAGSEACGQHLRVLQRGASNVYFPQVVSSLYLPLWGERASREIVNVLDQAHIWALLSQGTVNGKIDAARCETVAAMCGVDARELMEAAQRKLEGAPAANTVGGGEEDFRRSEYAAICEARGGPGTELYVESMPIQKYEPEVRKLFSRVQLVHKLRETRALAGFTRILPPDGSLASNRLQGVRLDPQIDWLPAIKVYGEGIFLGLNEGELSRWLDGHPEIAVRISRLVDHYNAVRTVRGQPQRAITPKFVLIHTLAHVLINQLSYESGYGSASVRERLYCDIEQQDTNMNGLLIYTASGDSEGSMGGLVRQGLPGRLELTLRNAIHRASWCSSDPVCIESRGQGADSANLAACHGCCLLPETSCEEGNRLLDRGVLTGIPENRSMGFFGALAV